jgi:SIR2-like protein
MLLVIFGAGASYDSVPSHPPNRGPLPHVVPRGTDDYRPPLANELFEERALFAATLERYQQCIAIVPYLRHLGKSQLEEVLEQLQTEAVNYAPGHQQLAAVRYYLHDMLWACGEAWLGEAHGVTNYRTLLDEINRFRKPDEIVSLVTFNYDTLLEPGLRDLGFTIRRVSDYIDQNPHYKVFKIHGSVNWGQVVSREGFETIVNNTPPTIERMIARVNEIQVTESFVLSPSRPMAWVANEPVFPAIAIPVQAKSKFACPQSHIDCLEKLLPRVTKILVIGWRATEWHFLRLLAAHLSKRRVLVYIVAGDEESARNTGEALGRFDLQLEMCFDKGGFTDFILEHRAQEFLGIEYK